MPSKYEGLKADVIDVLDDHSDADVVAHYGSKYSAKTRLTTLGISSFLRGFMVKPLNKRMRARFGASWSRIGILDMENVTTIGKLIEVCCQRSQARLPAGEPS